METKQKAETALRRKQNKRMRIEQTHEEELHRKVNGCVKFLRPSQSTEVMSNRSVYLISPLSG